MVDRRRARYARAILAAAIALAATLPLAADVAVSGEIRAGGAIDLDGATTGYGLAKASLDAAPSDAVKASMRVTLDDTGKVELERAYLKARFPLAEGGSAIRLTAGKSPLSWGRGFLFNAGDPIFGAFPAFTGFSASEYRVSADWLGALYVPFGDFSFIELVELPPVGRSTNRAGGRVCVTPSWDVLQSLELGYLYEQDKKHSAFAAIDGSLWLDWYAAFSLTDGHAAVSAGAFRMFDTGGALTVTARAEGLAYPEYDRYLWFGIITLGISDQVSVSAQGLAATGTEDHSKLSSIAGFAGVSYVSALPGGSGFAGISVDWTPLKEIALSASALKWFEKGDLFSPNATFALGVICKFQ
ncbi:MAG TPA: hypothetical protein PKO22_00420 [Treponemataceae bacterium]|nr:hypothetical protein [Treponemataceae bacterium]